MILHLCKRRIAAVTPCDHDRGDFSLTHPRRATSGGRASFASIAKASSSGMTPEFCDPRRRIERNQRLSLVETLSFARRNFIELK
jgi:hypothetical protein